MFIQFIRFLTSIYDGNKTHSSASSIAVSKELQPVNSFVTPARDAVFFEKTSALSKPQPRPLRTIQWVETTGKSVRPVSRLVISGRFADVCAEIERLAALEGA